MKRVQSYWWFCGIFLNRKWRVFQKEWPFKNGFLMAAYHGLTPYKKPQMALTFILFCFQTCAELPGRRRQRFQLQCGGRRVRLSEEEPLPGDGSHRLVRKPSLRQNTRWHQESGRVLPTLLRHQGINTPSSIFLTHPHLQGTNTSIFSHFYGIGELMHLHQYLFCTSAASPYSTIFRILVVSKATPKARF